jgi:hypothetical protein
VVSARVEKSSALDLLAKMKKEETRSVKKIGDKYHGPCHFDIPNVSNYVYTHLSNNYGPLVAQGDLYWNYWVSWQEGSGLKWWTAS